MKSKKIIRIAALAVAIFAALAMLASCSAASGKDGMATEDIEMVQPDSSNTGTGSTLPSYEEKGDMADSAAGGDAVEYAPKVIRTADITAETQDFSTAIAEVEKNVRELGGYIESCNTQNRSTGSGGRYANYVLRIPAESLDAFLARTGELLNVTSSSSAAKDISGEYYDIEARIGVLETEKALVEKWLSEASTQSSMLELERRLYDIIYEIESYKTAIKVYDSKVAYSTVNLNIHEVANITPVAEDMGFGTRLKNAVTESWQNTVELAEELLIVLIYVAPFLVALAVPAVALALIILIVVLIIRKRIRKAKKAS